MRSSLGTHSSPGETVTGPSYSADPLAPDEPFGEKNTVEVTTDEESDVGGGTRLRPRWTGTLPPSPMSTSAIVVSDDNGTADTTDDEVMLGTVCAFLTRRGG